MLPKLTPNMNITFWHEYEHDDAGEVSIKTDNDCRIIEKRFRKQFVKRHVLRVWKDHADWDSCIVAEFPIECRLQAAQMAGLLLLDPRTTVVGIKEIIEHEMREVDQPPWFERFAKKE